MEYMIGIAILILYCIGITGIYQKGYQDGRRDGYRDGYSEAKQDLL